LRQWFFWYCPYRPISIFLSVVMFLASDFRNRWNQAPKY
jgi:hypothetical protein